MLSFSIHLYVLCVNGNDTILQHHRYRRSEARMTQLEGLPDDTRTRHVGLRIRQLRTLKGVSARELASKTGITASYISRIENAKVSPTVATLGRIVQALGETFATLFEDLEAEGPIVRAHERHPLSSRGVQDYRVTPGWASRLEVMESIIQPGQGSGPRPHNHPGDEECVLVIEGSLTMWVDGSAYQLNPEDSATFPCRTPHRWRNPGTQPCRVLWIITPAIY